MDTGDQAVEGRGRRLWDRVVADAVPLGAFGVFFVAGIVWMAHPWTPVEDLAITELTVRRIGSHPPLAGAYSSLPFRHPGPLLFYWLWGPYELFGERSSALLAATLWFNGAVLALILGVARRLGGVLLALAVAAGVCLWGSAGGFPRLLHPWNPYVGAVPVLALVFLAWAMVEQKRWALPVAVGLGCWVVQAHIQFIPITVVLLTIGLGGLVVGAVRADGRAGLRSLVQPVGIAVGVGLVLWAPVIFDVVRHGSDSNLAAILRHYRSPQPERPRHDDVWLILRSLLSFRPTWSGGPRPYGLFLPGARMMPLALPIWIVAVGAAWRRRAWVELRGIAVALAGFIASVVALAGVTGPNFAPWYLIGAEGTGLAVTVLVVVSLVHSLRAVIAARRGRAVDGPPSARWVTVASIATVALVVTTASTMHRRHDEESTAWGSRQVLPAMEAQVAPGQPVVVEANSGLGAWLMAATVLELDRAGYRVYARPAFLNDKFPPSLSVPPPEDAVRLVVMTDPAPDVVWAPGVTVVDEVSYSLSPGEKPLHIVVIRAPLHAYFLVEPDPPGEQAAGP